MHCCCRAAPPQLKIPESCQTATSTNHLPSPAAAAPKAFLHLHFGTLQRLPLTLQHPMACPGPATHTLAWLHALWLPSAASSSVYLPKLGKPQTIICPVLPLAPVQAPPHLLHASGAAFDLAVPHGMPRAGHSHTGGALCAVAAECCFLLWKSPQTGKPTTPTIHLPSPAGAPSAGSTTAAAAHRRGCI